jgi:hypothetical protein
MKRLTWIIPAILLISLSAHAQNTPAWEFSGGYSYLRADLGGSNFNLNGGTATATENLNSWFGGRLDISAFHGKESGATVSAQSFMYGPEVSFHRLKGVDPFAYVELGGIHGSQGYLGISQAAFKFAAAGGAGVDVPVFKGMAVRVQADYMISRFLSANQNYLQGTVGLVYRFGSK